MNEVQRSKTQQVKMIANAGIGNVVEWYDFSIYAYFASIISVHFFETGDAVTGLLAAFAVFAVGFLVRPIGGFVIGAFGDKVGRKKALSYSVILMAVGTLMIGLLPSHQQIGIWAPILLVLARLIQGFSAGGEWTGGATFIVEHSNPGTRGFWGSFHMVSVNIGMLFGSLTGVLLTTFMSQEILYSWGWRIPFVIGGLIGLIGLYMRISMEETPEFKELKIKEKKNEKKVQEKKGIIQTLIYSYKEVLVCMGISIFWTIAIYGLLTYIPAYLKDILELSERFSFIGHSTALITLIILTPIAGFLSDKFGRKKILMFSTVGTLILGYPLFLMIASKSIILILSSLIIFAVLIATFNGPAVVTLAELFPANIRYSAFSVGYNITISIFGGTAPYISTFLVQSTGMNIAPVFYVLFGALITTVTLLIVNFDKFKEKQFRRVNESKSI